MRKGLPEIKKEISRKGSPKSAEKVLQISREKIQNQAANEKALPPKLSEGGFRYNLGCVARLSSGEERETTIVSRGVERCGGFSLLPPKHFVCRAYLQARA